MITEESKPQDEPPTLTVEQLTAIVATLSDDLEELKAEVKQLRGWRWWLPADRTENTSE
jgi:hypothetical protein